MDFVLSPDQQIAADLCLNSIKQGQETILTGAAGTGKTTLMKYIIANSGRKVVIGCPTGKAALRAKEVTKTPAATIHRLLYGGVDSTSSSNEPLFSLPKAPCADKDLLIVDEASMLGKKLYEELMHWKPNKAPVLFVGDKEQLEPVKDTWGPDLDNPTAALTQVHRQAEGSQIISFATAIRQKKGEKWLADWKEADENTVHIRAGLDEALFWYLKNRQENKDSILLTYTHAVRTEINDTIRAVLNYNEPLCPGDRILIRVNSGRTGLMNGEIVTVKKAERQRTKTWWKVHLEERKEPIWVNEELIEKSVGEYWKWYGTLTPKMKVFPWIHVWRGDCITVHSSQGSSWQEVGFIWDDAFRRAQKMKKDFARRFLYTGVTRAEEQVNLFSI